MDFDLSDEQREIQRTARELLARRSAPAAVRNAAEQRCELEALWTEVSALGWPGIAVPAEYGGQALGMVELCVLLEQTGAALAPIPLLATAVAAVAIARGGTEQQRRRWLARLATGDARGAVGMIDHAGALIAGAPAADVTVVFALDGSASLLTGAELAIEPLPTIDPLRRYGQLDGRAGAALAAGEGGEPLRGGAETAAAAAIAVAAECTGLCQRALDMTVAYVKDRKQFGVPIGSFQAVSHRCAEMLLHTESARSAVYGAAWAADAAPDRLAEAASLAKAVASDAALSVTSSAIQAHGGIGFTWEADVHWLYKRAQLDAELMGTASLHRARIAALRNIAQPAG